MTIRTAGPRRPMTPRALLPLVLTLVLAPAPRRAAAAAAEPPVTPAKDVADQMFGVTITDPYRWLEDGGSAETQSWVEAQNAYTRGLLDARPGREATRARL